MGTAGDLVYSWKTEEVKKFWWFREKWCSIFKNSSDIICRTTDVWKKKSFEKRQFYGVILGVLSTYV